MARAEDALLAERARLEAVHAARLNELATRCAQLELPEQAKTTRAWIFRRDPDRRYVFVPAPRDATRPAADAKDLVQKWHGRFTQHRTAFAEALFQLAGRALAAQRPTLAYELVHQALRENPNHAPARAVLGHTRTAGFWRESGYIDRMRIGRVLHPKLGWRGGSYRRVETTHFEVVTNTPGAAGRDLGRRLEALHCVWRQLFFRFWSDQEQLASRFSGKAIRATGRAKHRVVLFRNRDEYVAALKKAEPKIDITTGIYLNAPRMSFFYVDGGGSPPTQFHEATHQLFHEIGRAGPDVGKNANFWIVEGIALYMESLAEGEGYWTLGGIDANRLQYARRRALYQRFYLPLDELVGMGRQALQSDPRIRPLYSQSAGLAQFLMDGQQGRRQQAVVDYLKAVYAGSDSRNTLSGEAAAPYEALDREYGEFLYVKDEDLAVVAGRTDLRRLLLGRTGVTDEGMPHLAGLDRLEWLDLAYTKVTDGGTAFIAGAKKLKDLNLEHTGITSETLELVRNFTELEELDLSGTKVTDAGLARIAGLTKLRFLYLTDTRISDAALKHFTRLVKLETLEVSGTRVTPAAVKNLARSLPKLKLGKRQ